MRIVGRSPEGKWLHLEDKKVVATFDTREEAVEALKAASGPKEEKIHIHHPEKYWHHSRKDGERIDLGFTCRCGEYVIEKTIAASLTFKTKGGKPFYRGKLEGWSFGGGKVVRDEKGPNHLVQPSW